MQNYKYLVSSRKTQLVDLIFKRLIARYKKPTGCPVSSRQKTMKKSYSLVYQHDAAVEQHGIEMTNVKV